LNPGPPESEADLPNTRPWVGPFLTASSTNNGQV
jgi:hypothetical protein